MHERPARCLRVQRGTCVVRRGTAAGSTRPLLLLHAAMMRGASGRLRNCSSEQGRRNAPGLRLTSSTAVSALLGLRLPARRTCGLHRRRQDDCTPQREQRYAQRHDRGSVWKQPGAVVQLGRRCMRWAAPVLILFPRSQRTSQRPEGLLGSTGRGVAFGRRLSPTFVFAAVAPRELPPCFPRSYNVDCG